MKHRGSGISAIYQTNPNAGEIVLFDRSWYNRTGIDPGTDPLHGSAQDSAARRTWTLVQQQSGSAFNALEPL
jgi:polyphosphate kinase 2 (PPK2 family)